jgi:hypothetical protein
MVGGRAAQAESIFIGSDGRVQASSESTHGILHRLQEGQAPEETLFADLYQLTASLDRRTEPPRTPDTKLPEYFPPKLVLSTLGPRADYWMQSYPREEVPEAAAELSRRMTTLRDSLEPVTAEPGLYVRAQRIPSFDHRIQTPALVLGIARAAEDATLVRMLQNEMRLIRVGDTAESHLLAGELPLRPDRRFHLQVDQTVYRILSFSYGDPN